MRFKSIQSFIKGIFEKEGTEARVADNFLTKLHNLDLDTINHYANKVATYVCSQHGATPLIPEYLRVEYLRQKNTRLVHSLNEQN